MAFKRHHFQPDSPTNVFATINPLNAGSNVITSNGNLSISSNEFALATMAVSSGRWYYETHVQSTNGGQMGVAEIDKPHQDHYVDGGDQYNCFGIYANGSAVRNSTYTGYTSAYGEDTILGCCFDLELGKIWFSVNGVWVNGDANSYSDIAVVAEAHSGLSGRMCPRLGHYNNDSPCTQNFGQNPDFSGNKTGGGNHPDANGLGSFYYQPPAGALALCTENLPVTPITAHLDEKPGDYFKAVKYTGDGNTNQSITSVGFQPDFLWIKNRDQTDWHQIVDSVRGATKRISSNNSTPEHDNAANVHSFLDEGFKVGNDQNTNAPNEKYIAWCWKAGGSAGKYNVDGKAYASAAEAGFNAGSITPTGVSVNTKAGFSIVKYTGTGATGGTVPHGLDKKPDMVIIKNLDDGTKSWNITSFITTPSTVLTADTFNIGSKTGGVLGLNYANGGGAYGIDGQTSGSGQNHIAYCWHSVEGFSKFGSYEGSTALPFVYTGFRPSFLLLKNADDSSSWVIHDSARDPHNEVEGVLNADAATEEKTYSTTGVDFLSNGFKLRGDSSWYGNNLSTTQTVIYMAFAEKPETPASRVTITKPDLKANDMQSMYFDKYNASSTNSNVLYTTLGTATDDKVFTFSFWVKPLNGGHYGGDGQLLCMRNKTGNGGTGKGFTFRSGDTTLNLWLGSAKVFKGEIKTGDENKWYHLVFQSHNDNGQRGNVYIDGQLDPSLTEIDITEWNLAAGQYITIGGYDAGIHGFHGYMANVHLIDGQALLPSDFTETVDGVLIPKQYEGTYGNIGFHLDFAPENMEYDGDTITRVLDESPNSNHWDAK